MKYKQINITLRPEKRPVSKIFLYTFIQQGCNELTKSDSKKGTLSNKYVFQINVVPLNFSLNRFNFGV